jgi:hypothetical protein
MYVADPCFIFPDMVKIVTLQGRPKSNRKQLPQLNFDFKAESIGKSGSLPPSHKKQTLKILEVAVIHTQGSSRFFFGQYVNDFKVNNTNNYTFQPKLITNCVKYSHQ